MSDINDDDINDDDICDDEEEDICDDEEEDICDVCGNTFDECECYDDGSDLEDDA